MTSIAFAESEDSLSGRINGTWQFNSDAIKAISSQSVETIVLSIYFDSFVEEMVQPINGLLYKGLIFFLGRPLLPPLAGIIASTL